MDDLCSLGTLVTGSQQRHIVTRLLMQGEGYVGNLKNFRSPAELAVRLVM